MASATANRFTPNKTAPRPSPVWEPGREWQTVNAIHSKASLTMAEKSVLIAIAKNEARRNGFCHASTDTLASEVGCDPRTITSTVKILEKRSLVGVARTPGRSSSLRIDWKNFARLPSTTPLKNEGGAKMPTRPPTFSTVPSLKNGGRGVKSLEVEEKRGAAPGRSSQDQERALLETGGKAERTLNMEFQKLRKSTRPTSLGQPTDPLRAEFWKPILVNRLEQVFFDCQRLTFKEQLHACVESAVTDLLLSRLGKAMAAQLRGEHIAKLALEKLNGAEVVRLVSDFGDRADRCATAVRNAVACAAADLYEKQFPPARARSAEAKTA